MAEDGFLTAIGKITAGDCPVGALIAAADGLAGQGRQDLAAQLYRVWIGFNPDHPQLCAARFNLSVLLTALDDLAGARAELEAARALNPDFLPATINLGGVLERLGDLAGAVEAWRAAAIRPAPPSGVGLGFQLAALKQLARVMGERLQYATAEAALRQALELQPHQRDVIEQYFSVRLGRCQWPPAVPPEGMDRAALLAGVHPLSVAAHADDPLLQLGSAFAYVDDATRERPYDPLADRRHAAVDLSDRRLKVGYVSSDLRGHAIGYLMAELFEAHDPAKVEVFAYFCGRLPTDALSSRIQAAVEHWVDIRPLSDEAAARRMAADGIDVLVDVNGHTRDARLGVFARRPAPIQVNWLGYPGTMGSPFHHYIIADRHIILPDAERYYSERVVRLACYQPNDRKRAVAEPRPTRAEAGLPDEAFVFCSFNGAQKITRYAFDRWMEILKRTPGSVLWLLEGAAETQATLQAAAEAAGVAPGRLIFAPKQPNDRHLARLALADLSLDTSPYGAHTTASDALWMGVPVLTFWGRSFAARVCGSLVSAAGLPDLVCETPREYVERAVQLGRDPAAVAGLKARLAAARPTCDLFATDRLAADLEGLYGAMAADHEAGRTPRPDLKNLGVYLEVGVRLDEDGREIGAAEDYEGLWKAALGRRHLARPIEPDGRCWTAEDVARADGNPAPAARPRLRAAGGRR